MRCARFSLFSLSSVTRCLFTLLIGACSASQGSDSNSGTRSAGGATGASGSETSAGVGGAASPNGGAANAGSGTTADAGAAGTDDELPFDASKLIVLGAGGTALCTLTPDTRYLRVSIKNNGTTDTGRTAVRVATSGSSYELRLDTPALKAGDSVELQFDRGPLVGFTRTWKFSVVIDPDGLHGAPHAANNGECDDLRSRSEAGMVPLNGWYDVPSGLWNKDAWWTGANMLEASLDYMRETGDNTYVPLIDNSFTKNSSANFLNDYYDDEGWWALAWVKAYDYSHQQKYLDMAKTIFTDISAGWSDVCGGGVYWRKEKDGKNAIPNELFLTLAARLHQRTPGDEGAGSYLDWAQKEWAWFKGSGLISADNQVVDGLNNLTDCKPSGPAYTYNQGVILGGLTDLSQAMSDPTLLDTAQSIAEAAFQKMTDKNGVFIESVCDPKCGEGDGVQFKGIFARNVGYLYSARPLAEFQEFLVKQSDAIWNDDSDALREFGQRWPGPFDMADASRQSSALDALNGAIRTANMNLALHATATGSAPCTPSQTADRAIDGSSDWDNKWCSGGASGQVLTLDLGAPRYVVGFRVRHAGAGGEDKTWNTKDFEIQLSSDNVVFTPAVAVTGNTEDITTHPIQGTMARYARLHISAAQSAPDLLATRIYEFEVYGVGI